MGFDKQCSGVIISSCSVVLHELVAPYIDHRYRDRTSSLLVKEPGHTYFLSNQS